MANLLLNPGFETGTAGSPTNWLKYNLGTVGTYTYPVTPGRDGTGNCAKISASSNGATYWYQTVSVDDTLTYKLSGWINTQNVVGNGAVISIDWFSDLYQNDWIGWNSIIYKTGTSVWTQYQGVLDPPATAITANVCIILDYSSGEAWWDDMFFDVDTQYVNINITESPTVSVAKKVKKTLSITESNTIGLIKIVKKTFAIAESNTTGLIKIVKKTFAIAESNSLAFSKVKILLKSISISLTNSLVLTRLAKKVIVITETNLLTILKSAKKRIGDIILRKKHVFNLTIGTIYKYGDIMEVDSTWIIEAIVKDLFGNLTNAQTIIIDIIDPTGTYKVTGASMGSPITTGIYNYEYDIPLAGPKGKWTAKIKTTDVAANIERDTLYEDII